MATERQLRNQINELKNGLRECEQRYQNVQNQMNVTLRNIESEYDNALRRQLHETDRAYANRVRIFQEETVAEYQREYKDLQSKTKAILNEQNDKIAKLAESNRELFSLLRQVKTTIDERDKTHKAAAEKMIKEVKVVREDASKTPHEFFCSGEYKIIDSNTGSLDSLIASKMYEAAIADSNSIIMQFDLLMIRVNQALNEWMSAFNEYASRIRAIKGRMDGLEANKDIYGESELDFWSSGCYLPFKKKVNDALALVEDVERKGITTYLQENSDQNRRAIFSMLTDAKKWEMELDALIHCIIDEKCFSNERKCKADAIENMVLEFGNSKYISRFRPSKRKLVPEWNAKLGDPLESYELVLRVGEADKLYITIVPVRVDGVVVRNECLINFDAKTIEGEAFVRNYIDDTRKAILSLGVFTCKEILGIEFDDAQFDTRKFEESKRNKKPNPSVQVARFEKKYY